jgi:hypothetical protein
MNPLHWKREHQIAFLGAAVFGACVGIFAGIQQVEPSANPHLAVGGAMGHRRGIDGRSGSLPPPNVSRPSFKLGTPADVAQP